MLTGGISTIAESPGWSTTTAGYPWLAISWAIPPYNDRDAPVWGAMIARGISAGFSGLLYWQVTYEMSSRTFSRDSKNIFSKYAATDSVMYGKVGVEIQCAMGTGKKRVIISLRPGLL